MPKGKYTNEQRNTRTKHSGGGKGGSPAKGSGKVMCGTSPSKSKGANFKDSDSFLGGKTDDALKSVGSKKGGLGGSKPSGVKLHKGQKAPHSPSNPRKG